MFNKESLNWLNAKIASLFGGIYLKFQNDKFVF